MSLSLSASYNYYVGKKKSKISEMRYLRPQHHFNAIFDLKKCLHPKLEPSTFSLENIYIRKKYQILGRSEDPLKRLKKSEKIFKTGEGVKNQ